MQFALLIIASASMLLRPRRVPVWVGPAICVMIGLATTKIPVGVARSSLGSLGSPLLFVALAVPLAVTLDDIGVFASVANQFDGGQHLVAKLWWLAAGVVAVFNLDAAVVLLTPLYVQIARRQGLPVEGLAFQPVLLACLASGVLPVSNLTNLIVAGRFGLGVGDFLRHLAIPSIGATAVGYLVYRRVFRFGPSNPCTSDGPVDSRALRRGGPIIAFVLVGMTAGNWFGLPAWCVAAVALVWATALTGHLNWRTVPVGAVVVAASLAVLVAAATPYLPIHRVFAGSGPTGALRIVAFGSFGSNASNNLPVVLAGSTAMTSAAQAWPLLIGANIGSIFLVTASLSGLLWRDTAKRAGVVISSRRFASVGVRVGLPALIVAILISLMW